MAVNRRRPVANIEGIIKTHPGPYVAYVKSSTDVNRMGRLAVHIPELMGEYDEVSKTLSQATITVSYCSPFAGQTPLSETTTGTREYANTQKSYGFWMVPPDIDTKVLVMFANGDINQGYWIGCVFEEYMNHMTPGIADSQTDKFVGNSDQNEKYYVDNALTHAPVAEAQRRAETDLVGRGNLDPDKDAVYTTRPVNPYQTDTLLAQGLAKDSVRGGTTASARRETPSQVFGISTPGPIDFEGQQTSPRESINRHGKIMSGGGPNPGNTIAKVAHSRLGGHQFVMDDGIPAKKLNKTITRPIQDELIRLRTRSGAQLLLHNTEGLVYITNNSGTAWIEFTEDGKIDIYSKDSVSVHTENDFNLRAERDLNLEAGRNVNVKATGQNTENYFVNSDKEKTTGRVHIDASANIEMIAGSNINQKAGADYKLYAGSNGKIEVGTNIDFYAGNDFLANTGNEIHMNTLGKVTQGHVPSTVVQNLTTWTNAFINQDLSIMKRVPTAEPYTQHENKRRDKTTPTMTDRESLDEREIELRNVGERGGSEDRTVGERNSSTDRSVVERERT